MDSILKGSMVGCAGSHGGGGSGETRQRRTSDDGVGGTRRLKRGWRATVRTRGRDLSEASGTAGKGEEV
jgi:hypothetical protein